MKNDFPTIFIQEQLLFFSFSHFNWYLFLLATLLHQQAVYLRLSKKANRGDQI